MPRFAEERGRADATAAELDVWLDEKPQICEPWENTALWVVVRGPPGSTETTDTNGRPKSSWVWVSAKHMAEALGMPLHVHQTNAG